MRQSRLLPEEESATGYTVVQWYRLHNDALVLIYRLVDSRIYRMEDDAEFKSVAEQLYGLIQNALQRRRRIDVEWGCTSKHSECGNHADESEAVVTVQMAYEYSLYSCKVDACLAQLYLCALTAVYHKQLSPYLHYLRGGKVLECRQRGAASENVYCEWFQDDMLFLSLEGIYAVTVFQFQGVGPEIVYGEGVVAQYEESVAYLP